MTRRIRRWFRPGIRWGGHWTRHWLKDTALVDYLVREAYAPVIVEQVFSQPPLIQRLGK